MGEVLKFVTPDRRKVANGPTSSGPKPAEPGNTSPNYVRKKQKIKLGLKN